MIMNMMIMKGDEKDDDDNDHSLSLIMMNQLKLNVNNKYYIMTMHIYEIEDYQDEPTYKLITIQA